MTEEIITLTSDSVFTPTPVGLMANGEATIKEWISFGKELKAVGGAIQWLIGDWLNYGETRYGEKYKAAIEATGLDYGTLRNEKWVAQRFELSCRHDNMPFGFHMEVAGVRPEELADELLNKAEAEAWSVKELRSAVKELKHTDPVHLSPIDSEYDVIYADPPWKYEAGTVKDELTIEAQYPTMELEEIKNLEVPSAKDSVLFLWTTTPKLQEGLEVLNAWGFQYRTCAIWDKETLGMGYYFRVQHEILLVGKKGNFGTPPESARPRSIIRERRTSHSRKPDVVARIIEDMYPTARKIELFARRTRQGWTVWGNEIDNSQQQLESGLGQVVNTLNGQ